MTPTPRPAREWLRDTYWYCPAADMPALRTEATGVFAWVVDQTVWHVTGGADGYFWGVASTLLTPAGDTPDASQKSDSTFYASITPDGAVHITFVRSSAAATIGTGCLRGEGGHARFVMQMSSGPGSALVVHWAQMRQVSPDDPAWHDLPGAGVSVPDLVGGITAPQSAG